MKRSALIVIGFLVLSSQVFANDFMEYHLGTAGERHAEINRVLLDERSANNIAQSPLKSQLTTSGEKSSQGTYQIDLYSQETYNSLLEYHMYTAG